MKKTEQSFNADHTKRKEEHLKLAMEEAVQFSGVTTGLENYYFVHQALPEINLADIDLTAALFGKHLQAPLLISPMVGGIKEAAHINRNLALAAQSTGLAMGLGSQRLMIEHPELISTFRVREFAPDILLFANLGAVQLNYGFGVPECLRIIETVQADALVLHLNPLQEALQPEGNTGFARLLEKIESVCRKLPVPVIVKEVGGGISEEAAASLAGAGVAGIDVAGAGGTCWSEIERRRTKDLPSGKAAEAFSGWGIPTAESIKLARRGAPNLPLIASGGIRSGLDAAKAIALGADMAGIAAPLLKAAVISSESAEQLLHEVMDVMRIAMFCIGAQDIRKLKYSPFLRRV
jgi:isopentenyl-diphosphate Delta-isomerase